MRKTPCCVAQQFLVSCVFESQVELCQHDPLLLSVLFSLPGFDAEVAKMDAWRAMGNSMNVLKGIFSKSARNNGRIHFIQKVKDVSQFALIMLLLVFVRVHQDLPRWPSQHGFVPPYYLL
jgi:hypothetical protein